MNIYEINSAILNCIDEETGEILDIDKLHSLQIAKDEKIDNVASWIKNLAAQEEAIKQEENNLKLKREKTKNKKEQLKKYLSYATDGRCYETSRNLISFRKSSSVKILNDSIIDDEYKVFETISKIDKKAITDAIKSGIHVAGAEIEERNNIQIK